MSDSRTGVRDIQDDPGVTLMPENKELLKREKKI